MKEYISGVREYKMQKHEYEQTWSWKMNITYGPDQK